MVRDFYAIQYGAPLYLTTFNVMDEKGVTYRPTLRKVWEFIIIAWHCRKETCDMSVYGYPSISSPRLFFSLLISLLIVIINPAHVPGAGTIK